MILSILDAYSGKLEFEQFWLEFSKLFKGLIIFAKLSEILKLEFYLNNLSSSLELEIQNLSSLFKANLQTELAL